MDGELESSWYWLRRRPANLRYSLASSCNLLRCPPSHPLRLRSSTWARHRWLCDQLTILHRLQSRHRSSSCPNGTPPTCLEGMSLRPLQRKKSGNITISSGTRQWPRNVLDDAPRRSRLIACLFAAFPSGLRSRHKGLAVCVAT